MARPRWRFILGCLLVLTPVVVLAAFLITREAPVAKPSAQQTPVPEAVTRLRWLDGAKPEVDAQRALANGDHTLRGVYGLSLVIPGIPKPYDEQFYEAAYGVIPIEGTSDCLESDEHARLVSVAHEYAAIYNRYLLAHYQPPTDGGMDSVSRDHFGKWPLMTSYHLLAMNL